MRHTLLFKQKCCAHWSNLILNVYIHGASSFYSRLYSLHTLNIITMYKILLLGSLGAWKKYCNYNNCPFIFLEVFKLSLGLLDCSIRAIDSNMVAASQIWNGTGCHAVAITYTKWRMTLIHSGPLMLLTRRLSIHSHIVKRNAES